MAEIQAEHWAEYGRNYYSRHDFEAVPEDAANALVGGIIERLEGLPGQSFAGMTVEKADEFAYRDPVDGSLSEHQGLRVWFDGGARAVLRLSGTGTEGATIRLYLEHYRAEGAIEGRNTAEVLEPVRQAILDLAGFQEHVGRIDPDVIT